MNCGRLLSSPNLSKAADRKKKFRAGYVAILGQPNVGKSTLLNQLLKHKLSIVSRKPQTTRKKVLGIHTSKNAQIIFIDTPGLLNPKYHLQQVMSSYVDHAIQDADVIIYVVEASEKLKVLSEIKKLLHESPKPVILALNKIDLVEKNFLLPLIAGYSKQLNFSSIIPISALKDDGLDRLTKDVVNLLPVGPPYFPTEYMTDQQERFFVSEIIREKIYEFYGEEIPYSTHVQIEEFKERPGQKDYIEAIIYVEKASQKGIIIGKAGKALKRIGKLARFDVEKFLDRPVYLEIFVKVMQDWRSKESKLRQLGY
jgi:GTP-binding protein Era